MATLLEVKERIQGVESTQKITKAMKMVAATKLRKNEKAYMSLRPYIDELQSMINEIAQYSRPDAYPRMVRRSKVNTIGYIVIAADRGLCGAFNSNLLKKTQVIFEDIRKAKNNVVLYVLGAKAISYYKNHKEPISYSQVLSEQDDKHKIARSFAAKATHDYLSGAVDEVRILYHCYDSVNNIEFRDDLYIPISPQQTKKKEVEPFYEDNYREVMHRILPLYMELFLYSAILQSMSAEEVSRMMAMEYATENAGTLIDELTLYYHRTRQAVITKELAEVVGGAEAQKRS